MLVRAKNVPLSVIQHIPPEPWYIDDTEPTTFDSFIWLRFNDIRELSLRGSAWDLERVALEVSPQASLPPSLRSLRLWNDFFVEIPSEFPLEQAPLTIRTLSLENCFVPWHRLIRLFNLSYLDIKYNIPIMQLHVSPGDSTDTRLATYEELQSICDASPGLETLILEHCLPISPPPAFSHKSKLLRLNLLFLRGCLFGCAGVAQLIDMPPTTQITLDASSTEYAVHGVGFPNLLDQMLAHADKAAAEGAPFDCLSLESQPDGSGVAPSQDMSTARSTPDYQALLTRGVPISALTLPWNLAGKPYMFSHFYLYLQAGRPTTSAEVARTVISALIPHHIRHLFVFIDLRWSVSKFVEIFGPAHSIETLSLSRVSAAIFCMTLAGHAPRNDAAKADVYLPNLRHLYLTEIDHHLEEHGWHPYETLPIALSRRKEKGAGLHSLTLSYNWTSTVEKIKGFRKRIEAAVPYFSCRRFNSSAFSDGAGVRPTSSPQSRSLSGGSGYFSSDSSAVGHQIYAYNNL
ncbi:hypothetical protein OF83DRAFT_1154509, partial [Amylostereum chailletii]